MDSPIIFIAMCIMILAIARGMDDFERRIKKLEEKNK